MCEGSVCSGRQLHGRNRNALVSFIDALGRDLELVLSPKDVLARAFRVGLRRPEERLELGGRDDLPETSRGPLKVISAQNHDSRVGQDRTIQSRR